MTLDNIKNLPISPGVYRFLDEKGTVLYIGKAKNLKNRIRQYFQKELNRGPGIEQMVRLAEEVKWQETDSEIEALLLEAELVNKLQPKYNVRLRDDKSFLMIAISKEEFPCVSTIRFRNFDPKDKSADFFGPYPAGLLLKNSLKYLRKIFPYRDCSKTKYKTYGHQNRPCIFGDIRVCSAPCNNWTSKEQYQKNIAYLKSFLKGRKSVIIRKLEREMSALSKSRRFEEAALVRNQIKALDHLKEVAIGLRDEVFDANSILFQRIECFDISNIGADYAVGSMVVFGDGKPAKDDYRRFRIKSEKLQEESDLARLKQMLERRLRNDWPLPNLMIIDGGEMQLRVAVKVLAAKALAIPVISISKGEKRKKNDFHFSDANIAKYFTNNKSIQNIAIAARDEAHRFAIEYYRKVHRKEIFG